MESNLNATDPEASLNQDNDNSSAQSSCTENGDDTNMIELLDGSLIKGYPIKDAPQAEHWKGMKLDSSGQYFIISGKKPKQMNPRETEAVEAEKFFLEHAFFFLANAQRILSDSRMFLAPVPVQSGIAYTGTSGFTAPTLGIYIEWWLNAPVSLVEKNGNKYLTWHIAGSPLSGRNRCSIVDEQGKSHIHSFCGFSKLWRSFVEINTRYQPCKGRFESYTLDKVYELLGGNELESETPDKRKNRTLTVDCFFLRSQSEGLATELAKKEKEADSLREELIRARIQCNEAELARVYQQHIAKKEALEGRKSELLGQRAVLKKRMRSRELSGKEYQKLVGPINKELENVNYNSFAEFDYLRSQYKIQLSDVIEYFEAQEN